MVHNCPVVSRGRTSLYPTVVKVITVMYTRVGEAPALEHHVPQHAEDRDYSERQEGTRCDAWRPEVRTPSYRRCPCYSISCARPPPCDAGL